MRFASLGSGSEGNGLLVEAEGARATRILLDCGFGVREAERRLARLGVAADTLAAIVVTHEHGDHAGGAFRLARRYRLPVFATHGTLAALMPEELDDVDVRLCLPDAPFVVEALEIHPYAVPHDAREPVQFVFRDGRDKLGVLTDAGSQTAHMVAMLAACDALVLECNHDRDMLRNSSYPPSVKQRVGGAYGHLDNDTAARLLQGLDRSRLKVVVAAHLSRQNNTPVLARAALAAVLGCAAEEVRVADQDEGLSWTAP